MGLVAAFQLGAYRYLILFRRYGLESNGFEGRPIGGIVSINNYSSNEEVGHVYENQLADNKLERKHG